MKLTRAKLLRMTMRKSQGHAAETLNVCRKTVTNLENGLMSLDAMTIGFIKKCEAYYGQPIDRLIEEIDVA